MKQRQVLGHKYTFLPKLLVEGKNQFAFITTYTKTSDPESPESESSEESSDDTNSDSDSSQEQTSESFESSDQLITSQNEEEEIPFINMNTEAAVVEPDDEAEGKT